MNEEPRGKGNMWRGNTKKRNRKQTVRKDNAVQ